jgi:hypothetical protein
VSNGASRVRNKINKRAADGITMVALLYGKKASANEGVDPKKLNRPYTYVF